MKPPNPSPSKRRTTRVAGRPAPVAIDEEQPTPSPVPRSAAAEQQGEPQQGTPANAVGAVAAVDSDRSGRSGRSLVLGLSVATAVMTVLAIVLGILLWVGPSGDQFRAFVGGTDEYSEVLTKAREYAGELSTFDYRSIKEQRETIKSFSTDRWRKVLDEVMPAFDKALVEGKAVSKGTIHNAGVSEVTEDQAVVVLIVDQTITNSNAPQPRIDRNRWVMRLAKVDGEWKLDRVDLI